jgi:predicted DNA-binding protein with PD1-like motif
MTIALARLAHPGPRAPDRRQAAAATLRPLSGRLAARRPVLDEVARLFADHGCRGGILWLDGVTCDPMRFVLPALATDGAHAAFYSATHAPEGPVRIGASTATVGWRDGAPFLHCHGQWSGGFGTAMGHLLPSESVVGEDAEVRGIGSPDAWFEAVPDAETNFTLFAAASGGGSDGLVARLRPDEDVSAALAALCAEHRLPRARVHGIGSIAEPRFADGRHVPCVATEVRIDAGRVAGGQVTLDVSLVDVEGAVHTGRLAPGLNPVGVTFELLIEALP